MTTKMPQRPHPADHHEHGPRPHESGSDADKAAAHFTEPNAFDPSHQGMKGVTESSNSNRDVGQYTGEGQPANMKK